MVKSNGGSGTVSNVVLENFIGFSNAYSLNIEQYWSSMDPLEGDGVQLSNIQISNWTGTEADGLERGPIRVMCADGAPCTDVSINDFAMWTESGDSQWYSCQSAYTNENSAQYCLEQGDGGEAYEATTTTVGTAPTGYEAPSMPDDLATHSWGTTASIPIPTMPASFFPGVAPYSPLAGGGSVAPSAVLSGGVSETAPSGSSAVAPSGLPSGAPSILPSAVPSSAPLSAAPSLVPSAAPSGAPSETASAPAFYTVVYDC
jgi:rhamnogalacturonan hydrolase